MISIFRNGPNELRSDILNKACEFLKKSVKFSELMKQFSLVILHGFAGRFLGGSKDCQRAVRSTVEVRVA